MNIKQADRHIKFTNNNEAARAIALQPLKNMLSRQSCRDWLLNVFHPEGPRCPDCHQALPEERLQNFRDLRRVQCAECGKRYSAFTGTILEGAKISPEDFFLLGVFFAFGLRTKEIVSITGLSRQVVAIWRRKIRIWQSVGT